MNNISSNTSNLSNLRLAVLIDAENVPRNCIKRVMEEIAIYGTPTIKRIYGDWTSSFVSGWKNPLLQNAITPIQQYSYTQGKNSSDSAMIIDAMDILYSERTDGFVIVSSDSDFTRLAIRLREAGQRVIGIGERKTPSAFIAACDKFIYIEVINKKFAVKQAGGGADTVAAGSGADTVAAGSAAASTGAAEKVSSGRDAVPQGSSKSHEETKVSPVFPFLKQQDGNGLHSEAAEPPVEAQRAGHQKLPDDIIELIASSVADLAGDSGSVFMGELGNLILKKQPDFDHRNFGFKSLSALIKSAGRFEIEFRQTTDPNIKHVFVRDKEA